VPYIGYKFSDNIILNTELEFEHGGSNAEVAAEGGGENNVAAEGYVLYPKTSQQLFKNPYSCLNLLPYETAI
jgi:hypothetical protein